MIAYPRMKMNCLKKYTPALRIFLTFVIAGSLFGCGILESEGRAASSPLFTSDGKRTSQTVQSQSARSSTFGGGIIEIFQTNRCNDLSRGGFIWFTDEVVLNDWLSPLGPELAGQVKAKVDFSSQGVLLLDNGIAASPGAGIEVLNNQLVMKGSEAIVQIRQNKAASKTKKRAQVVTHSCSLHVMPRSGYKTLVIQSEQGDRLTSFSN